MSTRSEARDTPGSAWPALPLEAWKDTYDTLHMWTQIVGKIAVAQSPLVNHWWQASLRVTSRGFSTLPLPHGQRTFQIAFDFSDSRLRIKSSDGGEGSVELAPRTVADFYGEVMHTLESMGLGVRIWTRPVEVADPIPFELDTRHASYDPEYVRRFCSILGQADRVFSLFRSAYLGKVSPVQFFWGSFDLAVTRFSGRRAPEYTGGALNVARWVMEEAYSHEVSSLGFWPGGGAVPYPAFYSYAYPEPAGFAAAPIRPDGASYNRDIDEFILPYDAVRAAGDPDAALLEFAQSSYEAAANRGGWDRAALERSSAKTGQG